MKFGYSGILRYVDWYMYRRGYTSWNVRPEDEGASVLRNVGNYSPVNKLEISEDLGIQQLHFENS
jgi:hypothetical protein